jgi:hypothetical protein
VFRRAARALAFGVAGSLLPALVACQAPPDRGQLVPIPSSSIAAAPLFGNRAAVLAGDKRAKAIYIIDLEHKEVLGSFGVSPDATGVSAVDGIGPLLVSIGTNGAHQSGSIERWTIDGALTSTLPLPGPALGISRTISGEAYALVGRGSARAAVQVDEWPLRAHPPVPLRADIKDLDACQFGGRLVLLYSTPGGHVATLDVASHKMQESQIVANGPTCIEGRNVIFGVARSVGAANVVVLTFPGLSQVAAIPVSVSVVALYGTGDRRLMSLSSTSQVGTLEILPSKSLSVALRGSGT